MTQELKTGENQGGQPSALLWLSLLVLIGAALRLSQAHAFYYNSDEAMHAAIASGANWREVLRFAHYEIHPPLLYLLAHYWRMLSDTPAFMRGLPLLFGLALIPLYYVLGRRLDGPWTGFACAALIAFSHGCIIQSYVLRQYMPFVFFLTLMLLAWLDWRVRPGWRPLIAYNVCALLACSAHFSGIFAVAMLAAWQAWRMRGLRGSLATWLGVNALVMGFAALLYRDWRPVMKPLQPYFEESRLDWPDRLMTGLLYPFQEIAYILPGGSIALAFLVVSGVLWMFLREKGERVRSPNAECGDFLRLTAVALAFGSLLYVMQIYPVSGTRRNLWLLPFLVPAIGGALARGLRHAMQVAKIRQPAAGIMLLIVLGLALYSPARRFADGSEYVWQQAVWEDFDQAMRKLGPDDAIVTEKDDGIMLSNLYAAMGPDALSGASMLTSAPYGRARIFFNPYYPRNYDVKIFLSGLEQAEREHRFEGLNRLVFLRTAWSRSPLTELMLCPALRERVRTFPDFGPRPGRDELERARAATLTLTPEILRDEILSPAGDVHGCLKPSHSTAAPE